VPRFRVKLHPKQWIAWKSLAREILYGGAAGGGKSHLMRVKAISLCTRIPGLQVYIFRRKFGDLVKNHVEGPTGFNAMLAGAVQLGACKVTEKGVSWSNGSKIHLCHCHRDTDRFNYQGSEIHILLMDELTHFSDVVYRYLRARCRVPKELKIPADVHLPLILCGTNPGNAGHAWVKRAFIDSSRPMQIRKMAKEEGGFERQFIPALLTDNPSLHAEYSDQLSGLGSPELVKAMRDGDWNIVAGGALADVWNEDRQVLPQMDIPPGWKITRGFDWGSASPFSVLWFAESDGSPMGGRTYPRGSIIAFREWYGAIEGTEKGLNLTATEIAKGINQREKKWRIKAAPGPADNQINEKSNGHCMASDMAKEGVRWTKSIKSPGSRIAGLNKMRSMLKEAAKDIPEGPGFWMMERCSKLIDHLPMLCRDDTNIEDVDTDQPDHDFDVVRYKVYKKATTIHTGASPV
jgi:hypothetical protein